MALNREVVNVDSPIQTDWDLAAEYLAPVYRGRVSREFPVAIDPVHTARRIAVQFSRFTVHGTRPGGLVEVARSSEHLMKLKIPRRYLNSIRNDLRTCGMIDTAVFPDLEGLSRDLVRYWTTPWPS